MSGYVSKTVCLPVVESRILKQYSQFPTSTPAVPLTEQNSLRVNPGLSGCRVPLESGLLIGQHRSYSSSPETAGNLQLSQISEQ